MSTDNLCVYCGRPLVGKQSRYCSEAHRAAFRRARTSGRPDNARTDNPDGRAAGQQPAQAAAGTGDELVTFQALHTALARAEGQLSAMAAQIDQQAAELARVRVTTAERIISLERENARQAAELQRESDPQPFPMIGIVGMLMAILAFTLTAILVYLSLPR